MKKRTLTIFIMALVLSLNFLYGQTTLLQGDIGDYEQHIVYEDVSNMPLISLIINVENPTDLKDINFDFTFDVNNGNANFNTIFEDIDIKVNNASVGILQIPSITSTGQVDFSDICLPLQAGDNEILLLGDTYTNLSAFNKSEFHFEINTLCGANECANITLIDENNGNEIVNIAPPSIVFDNLEIFTPQVSITSLDVTPKVVALGTSVRTIRFEIETNANVTPEEFLFSFGNYSGYVTECRFYRETGTNDELIEVLPGFDIDSNGELEIEDLNQITLTPGVHYYYMDVSISEDDLFIDTVFTVSLVNIDLEFNQNGNNIDLSNELPVDGSTITIAESYLEVSALDRLDYKYVVGGNSGYVGKFQITAVNEAIELEDIEIYAIGAGEDQFVDAVQYVDLLGENCGNSGSVCVYGNEIVTSKEVYFNNINILVEKNETIEIKVLIHSNTIGFNHDGVRTENINFKMKIIEADGEESGNDITNIMYDGDSLSLKSTSFAVVPVIISDIEFLTQNQGFSQESQINGSLADQNIAVIKVTAGHWQTTYEEMNETVDLNLDIMSIFNTNGSNNNLQNTKVFEIDDPATVYDGISHPGLEERFHFGNNVSFHPNEVKYFGVVSDVNVWQEADLQIGMFLLNTKYYSSDDPIPINGLGNGWLFQTIYSTPISTEFICPSILNLEGMNYAENVLIKASQEIISSETITSNANVTYSAPTVKAAGVTVQESGNLIISSNGCEEQ